MKEKQMYTQKIECVNCYNIMTLQIENGFEVRNLYKSSDCIVAGKSLGFYIVPFNSNVPVGNKIICPVCGYYKFQRKFKGKKMSKLPLTTMLILMLTTMSYASENSVVAKGGWLHTASSAYDDSSTGSVRYEHHLYKNLWIGPEYTYHGPMSHNNGQDVSYGDVSGHSVLLDILYYPSVSWKLKPYILAGAGWSWWNFDETELTNGIEIDLGDAFAYKVGVGASYSINSSWSLIAEWSFFKTDIPKEAHNPDGSKSILLGDDHGKIGEEETMLTVGLKYSF